MDMASKLPEEFLYEYVVSCDGQEIAVYYSDAAPPETGSLINPWEFAQINNDKKHPYQGPYRVIEINQQPKNMDGAEGEVSTQTLVNLVVEKPADENFT
jgi:hypothetical protein